MSVNFVLCYSDIFIDNEKKWNEKYYDVILPPRNLWNTADILKACTPELWEEKTMCFKAFEEQKHTRTQTHGSHTVNIHTSVLFMEIWAQAVDCPNAILVKCQAISRELCLDICCWRLPRVSISISISGFH